jgi:hypothetical protein
MKNNPQQEMSCFEVLNVLFGGQNIAIIDKNIIIFYSKKFQIFDFRSSKT